MLKKTLTALAILAPLSANAAYTADVGGQKLHFHKPYVKGYAGYGIDDDLNVTVVDAPNTYKMKKIGKGAMGSVGLGIGVNKNWRLETEFYANNGMTAKRGGAPHLEASHYANALLFDVYYDFDEIYPKYRPYVLAGVGLSWTKMRVEYLTNTSKKSDDADLAWQLGLGVNRNFGDFDIDIGYRMINLGQNHYSFDFTTPAEEIQTVACIIHAGIIGVNFRF
jgi:opacity protein-like surface antigen